MDKFDSEFDHGSFGYAIAKLGVKDIKKAHQLRTDVYKVSFMIKTKKTTNEHV